MLITSFMTTHDNGRSDPLESDYYVQAFISKKLQDFDFDLFQTKWFDYRHMTPLDATLAYIDAFGEVYRKVYMRQIDRERGEHLHLVNGESAKKGLNENNVKMKRSFAGYWRGRQIADALGMPYLLYIELAMEFRLRHWQRAHLPRPEHLYHEWDVEKVQLRWEELQSSALYFSEHPAYLVENFVGTAPQNAYHEWLFSQAALRQNGQFMLARFVGEGRLPLDKVRARMPEADFERVTYYLEQA